MTAPNKLSRASSLTFAVTATFLTIIAYSGGKYIQNTRSNPALIPPSPKARLAQAGRPSLTPSRISRNSVKSVESEKFIRVASQTFVQVHDLVRSEYVDKLPSEQVMSHGAVRAMLSALEDEQSYFVTASERHVFDAEGRGNFQGIGAVTAVRSAKTKSGHTELRLMVVAPISNSPAFKAGLRTGDRITHLDGRYILGDNPYLTPSRISKSSEASSPAEAHSEGGDEQGRIQEGIGLLVAQMRLRQGTSGTHTLTIQRGVVAKPIRISVANAKTTAPDLMAKREKSAGKSALYLRVRAFTESVGEEVTSHLSSIPADEGVVLDLRQNPGSGSLEVAETIAANLITTPEPFAIEIGPGGKRTPLPLPLTELSRVRHPISVLTDRGTAGFAEALASRLADAGATIVGTGRTWGDGRSQTLYSLDDGSAFTLTTGKLVSPKGTAWEHVGLAPRVVLPGDMTEAASLARAVAVVGRTGGASVAKSLPAKEVNR